MRVTELTPDEIDELWSLRAVLESSMAEATVRNTTPAQLAELKELVRRMDEAEDAESWSNLNYTFHDRLYVAAGLPHFRATALRVLTQIEPYSRVAAGPARAAAGGAGRAPRDDGGARGAGRAPGSGRCSRARATGRGRSS